ncbi:MAG: long-chain fatty acid--CoA ligase [Gammaproteobacteria bacterium]|nr:MAG: long-chain fatty acid--CoA ligase [Gammaproteobacteria bacterium]
MKTDIITPKSAKTLSDLFSVRVNRSSNDLAYQQFDLANKKWHKTTWHQMAIEVGRWQDAIKKENLKKGDRVAVMLKNCRNWVVFDQAAMGLGLVTVPLYMDDRPDNTAYILKDSDCKLLVVEGRKQWQKLASESIDLSSVQKIISINTIEEEDEPQDSRLESLDDWVYGLNGAYQNINHDESSLASIVYTSGTTGKPKGVMLTHNNILLNAYYASQVVTIYPDDIFLSFLPLSHTLERTGGLYLPMLSGASVSYARSVTQLGEDLQIIKPTIMISVPRIYERVYGKIKTALNKKSALAQKLFAMAVEIGYARFEHQQKRGSWRLSFLLWPVLNKLVAKPVLTKLGGNLRFAVAGGAPLPTPIARVFLGLGVNILHGYGLTESSPIISCNMPEFNLPESIGPAMPQIKIRIGDNDELQTKSSCVMQGYWNLPKATADTFTQDGWLKTGDKARIDEDGRIFITGRIKEIIVLGNGEKVPPADMEMAIALDNMFEQVMVIGEGKAFLSVIITLSEEEWAEFVKQHELDVKKDLNNPFVHKKMLQKISEQTKQFPGFAKIRKVILDDKMWSIDSGLITPKMSMKRNQIMTKYDKQIKDIYDKFEV